MNQNWGIYACIGAFALTFAGGFALILNQRKEGAKVEAPPAPRPAPEPDKEVPKKPPEKKDGIAPKDKPPVPSRPILIKQWQGTQPPKPKGEDSPNYEDFFYRELFFDRYGARLVGCTSREAVCWDALGGTRLQTFPAATHTTPRKPPNPPDFHIDQDIRISPDGRTVAMIDRNGKSVTLYDAGSGARIAIYTAPKDRSQYTDHHPPEFTPRSGYLIYCTNGGGNKDELCAVSASTGAGRKLDLGRAYTQERFAWVVLIPVLDESTLIRQQHGDAITALDLRTGKERALKSISVKPFSLFENRGIKMSPNRRYLSARTIKTIEIVDWKEDKRIMQTGATTIHNEWWTPDGKRIVMLKSTDWIQYVNNVRTTPIGGWLELWDVEKGVKISDFAQDKVGLKYSVALAFSPDGKLRHRRSGGKHRRAGFEMAFKVARAPVPRPWRTSRCRRAEVSSGPPPGGRAEPASAAPAPSASSPSGTRTISASIPR